jgi:hypothetical protein
MVTLALAEPPLFEPVNRKVVVPPQVTSKSWVPDAPSVWLPVGELTLTEVRLVLDQVIGALPVHGFGMSPAEAWSVGAGDEAPPPPPPPPPDAAVVGVVGGAVTVTTEVTIEVGGGGAVVVAVLGASVVGARVSSGTSAAAAPRAPPPRTAVLRGVLPPTSWTVALPLLQAAASSDRASEVVAIATTTRPCRRPPVAVASMPTTSRYPGGANQWCRDHAAGGRTASLARFSRGVTDFVACARVH